MSFIPRLPLFAATLTLLTLALAVVFLSGQSIPAAQAQTTPTTPATVDYDSNDDRLIEISNLAQLNAIRWDLNGDGAVDANTNNTAYTAAFPNAAAGMGCPDGSDADTNPDPCLGYELKADLTFDTNGDGSVTAVDSGGLYWNSGAGWTPIGSQANPYTGQFQSRGKVISRLFISNGSAAMVGLFGALGAGSSVAGLGLAEVSIASSRPAVAGGIVGSNSGSITASYATGAMTINVSGVTTGNSLTGGLVGHNASAGAVQASFADVAVSATHSSTVAVAGGLAGQNDGNIRASYATGTAAVNGSNSRAGGLAGNNGGTITASYARGRVTATGSGAAAGGLVGGVLRSGTATASYWDTTASGQTASAGGTGQSSSALQTPAGYSGIYANWNLNLDGVTGGDSPWHFGGGKQYPILVYGTLNISPQRDYDADNDRLLEVNDLAQLNAIRWDLNADGVVTAAAQSNYTAAFPGAIFGMGCAQGATAAACNGYELQSDLDFDTDGDSDVDAADSGGLYWNNGQGWRPIGEYTVPFSGTFQGNGKTIANLYIHQPSSDRVTRVFGLFASTSSTVVIDSVNLRDVNIRVLSGDPVGALTAWNLGTIRNSSATGSINSSDYGVVGGLVGGNSGRITGSHAKVEITGKAQMAGGLVAVNDRSIASSYSSGAVLTNYTRAAANEAERAGGLVAVNNGTITASYSHSSVKATGNGAYAGGLAGSGGTVTASYATGPVVAAGANSYVGGLVGAAWGPITASYAMGTVKATGANSYVGGLAGSSRSITAAYSRSPVKATGNGSVVGGLVGYNWSYRDRTTNITYPATIVASYAMGPLVATGTGPSVGGLVGRNGLMSGNSQVSANGPGTAADSYWDAEVSGQSSSPLGTGISGTGMRAYGPTTYGGLFANWNLNLDGVAGNDDPWTFPDGQYPILKYGGLDMVNQLQLYIWDAPQVGRTARTSWHLDRWLTKASGQGGFIWERSADGVTWTVVRSTKLGIGRIRNTSGCSCALFIEPYEANQWFRVRRPSNERGWISGYVSRRTIDWNGPTATLTFASGHSSPRVGQAIAITGTNNVKWIRCDDAAGNGCNVIVAAATGYTPVAADQGKYLYAYRYYDNSSGVKTMGKTAYIGPVAAAATTP